MQFTQLIRLLSTYCHCQTNRFLEGIHVFRNHDQVEFLATVNHLPAFLRLHTKVKIILIDSVAFHFRQDINEHSGRSRVLSGLAQSLNQLAYDFNLAVVLINHITTRFVATSNGSKKLIIDKLLSLLHLAGLYFIQMEAYLECPEDLFQLWEISGRIALRTGLCCSGDLVNRQRSKRPRAFLN